MTMTEDERRARDYRIQQERRCAAEAAREQRLQGNPAARQALADAWQPLLNAADDIRSWDEECAR